MNTAEIEELVSILEKDGRGYPLMQASAVALRQLLDERKWRPIETAEGMKSKGQQILAIMGPWKSILIAHWSPDMHAIKPRPCWQSYELTISACRSHQPKLWLPLPQKPEANDDPA